MGDVVRSNRRFRFVFCHASFLFAGKAAAKALALSGEPTATRRGDTEGTVQPRAATSQNLVRA